MFHFMQKSELVTRMKKFKDILVKNHQLQNSVIQNVSVSSGVIKFCTKHCLVDIHLSPLWVSSILSKHNYRLVKNLFKSFTAKTSEIWCEALSTGDISSLTISCLWDHYWPGLRDNIFNIKIYSEHFKILFVWYNRAKSCNSLCKASSSLFYCGLMSVSTSSWSYPCSLSTDLLTNLSASDWQLRYLY